MHLEVRCVPIERRGEPYDYTGEVECCPVPDHISLEKTETKSEAS